MNTIIAVAGILFGIYISRQAMKFRTSKQQLYLGYAAIWLFALGFYWELIASWKDISTTPEMAFLSGFWYGTDKEAMFVRFFFYPSGRPFAFASLSRTLTGRKVRQRNNVRREGT